MSARPEAHPNDDREFRLTRDRKQPIPSADDHGAGPDNPLEIGAAGWKETMRRAGKRFSRDRVTMSSGSLAYHGFLALFPAVIAGLGVLTLISIGSGTIHSLTHGIDRALPAGASGVFDAAVRAATRRSGGSLAAVIIGILIALWSVSSGFAALQQALDTAYEVPDRKFLARRLRALPMLAATVVFGGLAVALIVFGAPIGSAISGHIFVSGTAFTVVWTIVRWIGAIVFMTLLFSAYYYFGPNRETPSWQWVSPGGLVGTAIFLLASLGFSFYVSSFGNYGKTYGSFAGVAILIFWMYLSGIAVLLGAEINAEVEREAAAEGGDVRAQRDAASVAA